VGIGAENLNPCALRRQHLNLKFSVSPVSWISFGRAFLRGGICVERSIASGALPEGGGSFRPMVVLGGIDL